MSKSDNNFDSMTVLEREKVQKKQLYKDSELIEAMGQESEIGAAKLVQKYVKDVENEEQRYTDEAMEILHGLISRGPQAYNDFLAVAAQRFLSQEDYPRTFKVNVIGNRIGVVINIVGSKYYGAFKASFLPQYDYMACKILAVKTGNTIAKMMGSYNKTAGGLFIPDEDDKKKINQGTYGRTHKS